MTFRKTFLILTLIVLSGCATPPSLKKIYPTRKSLSKKERTLLRYRKLRMKNFRIRKSKNKKGKITSYLEWYKSKKKRGFFKATHKRVLKKRAPHKIKSPSRKRYVQKRPDRELKIEIEQNLAYFCFSPEKRPKRLNHKDCKSFTTATFIQCQEKYRKEELNNVLICVKKNLKAQDHR
jgi:hypothetical protein